MERAWLVKCAQKKRRRFIPWEPNQLGLLTISSLVESWLVLSLACLCMHSPNNAKADEDTHKFICMSPTYHTDTHPFKHRQKKGHSSVFYPRGANGGVWQLSCYRGFERCCSGILLPVPGFNDYLPWNRHRWSPPLSPRSSHVRLQATRPCILVALPRCNCLAFFDTSFVENNNNRYANN